MAHTRDWSSEVPIDHTKFKAIPGAIAALALDIEERLAAFFYGFTSGETSDGIKYLPFWVQTTAPTGAANKVCMYAEDSNSKAALKVKTEDNAEIQLTERDWGLLDDFALSNAAFLRGRNAADNGFINLLKVNASDIGEFATFPITPSAAPDADYEVANKKYVDDEIAGVPAQVGLGAWASRDNGTIYQAATDGFLVGVLCGRQTTSYVYTDSSNPPTTARTETKMWDGVMRVPFCVPVKKNDYYKMASYVDSDPQWNSYAYWIPLGS